MLPVKDKFHNQGNGYQRIFHLDNGVKSEIEKGKKINVKGAMKYCVSYLGILKSFSIFNH